MMNTTKDIFCPHCDQESQLIRTVFRCPKHNWSSQRWNETKG